ncbi:hypothetical protein [Pseudomonas caricapapayae]|uniref:hypothetical protein n=1 Tax=Pseudomonas caricapapayae TaxID=46678 RepID=UPI0006D5DD1E|nr:hypothetical protein [Pseudomonas caricapapayae]KAA8689588.1 hypothetical protein F4W67_27570 [Pseudomonas caricapapayae]
MSNDKMREEFEAIWGFTNEEQECYFIPELNMYGSARVNRAAESKSTAWAYFQKGWKASREALVIELPDDDYLNRGSVFVQGYIEGVRLTKEAIEAAGVKVKP